MKLQLDGQQLRVRVSEAEFARLLAGEPVESATVLPGSIWCLQLQPVSGGALQVESSAEQLRMLLPKPLLAAYQSRLPCRDGIEAEQTVPGGPPLRLSFEVDVRDSVRTRGPRRRPTAD